MYAYVYVYMHINIYLGISCVDTSMLFYLPNVYVFINLET